MFLDYDLRIAKFTYQQQQMHFKIIILFLFCQQKQMSSPQKIINGDYYQINRSGHYQRHQDVKVHSYDHQNFNGIQKQLINEHKQQQKKISNNNTKNNDNPQILTPKFAFSSNCVRILQKQQVASIHQQESQQQNNKQKYEEHNRNIKMRRSTQHDVSPKKGILKRSMVDSKMEISAGKKGRKNQMMNRSVRMQNVNFTNQSRKMQSQCQISIQRLPSTPSQMQDQHNRLKSGNEKRKIKPQQLNNFKTRQASKNKIYPLSSRLYMRPSQLRINTEGIQTIANSYTQQKGNTSEESEYESSYNDKFTQTVYNQLNYMNLKLNNLEQQLNASQQRMKSFALQQQLRQKQTQIMRIKRQNQYLKQKQQSKNSCIHENKNINQTETIRQKINMQWKLNIAITFVILLILYLIWLKPFGTCTKNI